jgi:hypothetical protein
MLGMSLGSMTGAEDALGAGADFDPGDFGGGNFGGGDFGGGNF